MTRTSSNAWPVVSGLPPSACAGLGNPPSIDFNHFVQRGERVRIMKSQAFEMIVVVSLMVSTVAVTTSRVLAESTPVGAMTCPLIVTETMDVTATFAAT